MTEDQKNELLIRIDERTARMEKSHGDRLNDHALRLRVLEGVAKTATVLGAIALAAAGAATKWIKIKVSQP